MKFFNLDNVNFNNVGGLEEHIRCLKELVLFPLIYRDIYDKFHIKPPRGVLFHGPPGTGKTMLARALANECSRADRKVSFFSRKGAECLSKWVGESEKKLRTLFETAQQLHPSIIFFDEIDGLAPTRSSRQDQVHSSVVSTLLALMDGLDGRTEVIVIGATNRIDAIDPALRRSGRFDRELYFPPPAFKARKDILHVYLDQWNNKPSSGFINQLASNTVGFCGSDLQALCSEAVMCGLRRQYPNIYTANHKINVDSKSLQVENCDFHNAKLKIIPALQRTRYSPVKRMSNIVCPLLQNTLDTILNQLKIHYPFEFLHLDNNTSNEDNIHFCPRLLLTGTPMQGQTSHVAPAILHNFEHLPVHILDIGLLLERSGQCTEESCIQKMKEVRQNLPAILYLPNVSSWWNLVDEGTRIVFLDHLHNLDSRTSLFLLATSNTTYHEMPRPLQELFNLYQGQIVEMENPSRIKREKFFRSLFTVKCILPPSSEYTSVNSCAPNRELDSGSKQETDAQSGRRKVIQNIPKAATRCSRRLRGLTALTMDELDARTSKDCNGSDVKTKGNSFLVNDSGPPSKRPKLNKVTETRSSKKCNILDVKSNGNSLASDSGPSSKKPKLSSSKRFPELKLLKLEEDSNPGSGDVMGEITVKQEPGTFKTEFPSLNIFHDDIDEAMTCCELNNLNISEIENVIIDRSRLLELLHRVLTITEDFPVHALEILHDGLSTRIMKYQHIWDRTQLPAELEMNIDLFEEIFVPNHDYDNNCTCQEGLSIYMPHQS